MKRSTACLVILCATVLCAGMTVAGGLLDIGVGELCLQSNDISGWTAWEHPCTVYVIDDLYAGPGPSSGSINGSAGVYDEHGLVEYIYQQLNSGSKNVAGHVMDFGTADSAQSLFSYMAEYVSGVTDDTVPGLGPVTMMERYGGTAVYVLYAIRDRFYFELAFSGMSGDSEAIAVANDFLTESEHRMGWESGAHHHLPNSARAKSRPVVVRVVGGSRYEARSLHAGHQPYFTNGRPAGSPAHYQAAAGEAVHGVILVVPTQNH